MHPPVTSQQGVAIEEPDIEAAGVLGAPPLHRAILFQRQALLRLYMSVFVLCRRMFYAHPIVLLLCSREREEEEQTKNGLQGKAECKVRFEENVQEDGQADVKRQATCGGQGVRHKWLVQDSPVTSQQGSRSAVVSPQQAGVRGET